MINDFLVSIIIPVYNGSNYVKEAIDSALAQTYKRIEIIVINDGSTDDGETERIALAFGDKIRYYYKPNGGCASALNFGISVMKGEYFSWLSHDDLYFPNKIEKQVSLIREKKLDKNTVLSCEAQIIDKDGNSIFYKNSLDSGFYDSEAFFSRLLFGKNLNGCGLLIHKDILKSVGPFNQNLIAMPDWDYWVRISLSGFNLYRHGIDILVSNRVSASQVSARCKNIYPIEYSFLIKNYFDDIIKKSSIKNAKSLYFFCVRKGKKECIKDIRAYLKQNRIRCFWGTVFNEFLFLYFKFRSMLTDIYWKLFRKR